MSADIRDLVARSRERQGLPPTIQDPAALERCAAVFRLADVQDDDNRIEEIAA